MFENYSIGDLFSNIYKKRLLNIITFIVLSIALVCPLVLKTINKKTVTKEGVKYSTYVSYKITAPENDNINWIYGRRGFADFYEKLLTLNLNGAYLFNDVSDEDLNQMAKELDTSATTLKNSNFDYWDKKVVINYISTNLGVSAKILTPSKLVNDLIEKKFDELINKYKNYMESDISKNYTDGKLISIIEYKNSILESITIFEENNNFKQEIEYADSKQLDGTFRRYENDKIVEEIIFENNLPKVKKLYHQNGNLAVEMPVKNGKVDGEVKSYYENGNIQGILYYKNGFLIHENEKTKGATY